MFALFSAHYAYLFFFFQNCSPFHPKLRILKTKVALCEQLSWLNLLSDVTSDAILGNGELRGRRSQKLLLVRKFTFTNKNGNFVKESDTCTSGYIVV